MIFFVNKIIALIYILKNKYFNNLLKEFYIYHLILN